MFGRLRTLVGGLRSSKVRVISDALPNECATLLAAVSFMDRGDDGEGKQRIIVLTPQGVGFSYGPETARTWLRNRFDLTDKQMARALQMLRSRFAEFQRQSTFASAGRAVRWADWRPLHEFSEF